MDENEAYDAGQGSVGGAYPQELGESDRILSFGRQFRSCGGMILTKIAMTMLEHRLGFIWTNYPPPLDKIHIGVAIGAELSGIVASAISLHFVGRKITMFVCAATGLVPVLLALIEQDQAMIRKLWMYARIFVATGVDIIHYVYAAELADPRTRAFFCGTSFLSLHLGDGTTHVFSTNSNLSLTFAALMMTAALVLSAMSPESPYWLALNGRRADAEQVFQWLRAGVSDAAEMEEMCDRAEEDAVAKSRGLLANLLEPAFLVTQALGFFLRLSDLDPCRDYVTTLTVRTMGIHEYESIDSVYGRIWHDSKARKKFHDAFVLFGTLSFLPLSFVVGRRPLFFASTLMPLLIHLVMEIAGKGNFMLIMNLFCNVFPALGSTQIVGTVTVEIFPAVTRDIAAGMNMITKNPFQSLTLNEFAAYGSFRYYLGLTIRRIIFYGFPVYITAVFIFMPETKDLTLAETEDLGKTIDFRILNPSTVEEEETQQ